MDQLEREHWWFTGRRRILDRMLARLKLPADAQILEVGCGTGGNLAMLSRYGELRALELDDAARAMAQRKSPETPIEPGRMPHEIPFAEERPAFDLIVLFDVLEHIDEDAETLRALRSRLKPDGRLMLTVPAYQSLWSPHDETHHHKRRYRRSQLRALLKETGFRTAYSSYFNVFLFPLVLAIRLVTRAPGAKRSGSDAQMPSPFVNRLLSGVFGAERFWMGRIAMPFGGVSILALARPAE